MDGGPGHRVRGGFRGNASRGVHPSGYPQPDRLFRTGGGGRGTGARDPQRSRAGVQGLLAGLSGRREITAEDFEQTVADSREIMDLCHQVLDWQKRRTECAADIQRISTSLEQMAPWQSLDVSFRFGGTRTTAAFIGVLPARFSETELRDALAGKEPGAAFEVEVLHTSPEQTCLFLLLPEGGRGRPWPDTRSMGFSRPPVTAGTSKQGMLPTDEIDRLQDRRRALEEERADLTRQIEEAAANRRRIENTIDYYTVRAEKYRIIGELGHTRHTLSSPDTSWKWTCPC